ncbi:MAG: carboxypeptidase regulatory-like domain-containing protein [Bacteroidales bacterium]|nr:carboxypeptidase regulatory-like domain-containing protein [Bacteroidales bacterium]MDD4384909.1 carboxypeptidase regulatory-like domain-containing protein [Bacteroidales bacterium]MDY0196945.1 carboxypeptidase regulatory-like domain-containing protein [Tenuifilaceae bacterium]
MKKLFLFLFLSALGIGAFAQVTTSAINGRVVDDKGEPVPFAIVVALHEPSGTTYGTTTQDNGSYVLMGLRVGGPYKISISFMGYTPVNYTDIDLKLGETFALNGVLKESAYELETVVISAGLSNPILNSDRTGAQTNISRREMDNLPTISRSITDFARLTPQAQGNSFGGRDGRFNTITIDGAAFNNNFGLSSNPLPGGNAQPIALDAIEQITVSIAPFDVRLSQFTGASINAVTRSGDNTFKGTVYSYMRPKSFTGSTVDGIEVSGANDRNSQNYGISLGGPIIKNKLFIFVNGEMEKEDIPGINWKPSTDGVADPDLGISRTTEADMELVRNHLMTTYGYDPGKYKNFDAFQNLNTKILARIDWNINKDHKLTFRYNDVVGTSDQPTNSNSIPSATGLNRGSGRISKDAMSFSNSFYGFKNTVRSFTGELNSSFKNNISNKFLASYTFIQDTRTSPSALFPFVDIWEGGDQYMSFGYELFSYNNDVTNKTLSIVNNTSITVNDHTFTLGASFDRMFFRNSYIREGTSYYRYGSVNDFITGADPIGFGVTYGYNGEDAPGSELTFGLGALYAQDEFKASQNLKLTFGLRVELPFFFDEMKDNPAISALTFANGQKIDVSSWPDQQLLVSPRFGFNWDAKGDRSLQVRGGTGIFTGLLPFVWFTNQPTNSGLIQVPEIGWGPANPNLVGLTFNPDFKGFIASRPDLFPVSPGDLPPGASLAEVSKDFKMPQVWRTNLAVDIKLPSNIVFTGEAIFGKDINAIKQVNINEADPAGKMVGPDNRDFWTAQRVVSSVGNATVLTNTDEGYQYSLTAQLTKGFTRGFSGMFAYTYSAAKDISNNPGSAAFSAYSSNSAVGSLNNPGLSYSNFSTPHQLIAHGSYRIEYAKILATTFTVAYRGFQQGRWSYTYSNDLNNDGISSDLMYIPKSENEITFVDYTSGGVTMTAAEQATAFWAYVNDNDYLSKRKGEYAERFGHVRPWLHRFDVKVLQDIFTNFGSSKRYTLQISLDLLNVGNMISDKWGTYSNTPLANYDNVRPLTRVGLPTATTAPTFRLNANSIQQFKDNSQVVKSLNTSSTWGALLGIRLTF